MNRCGSNADDIVAAVHDITFAGDKNIIPLRQKGLFRFPWFVGKTKKLQWDIRWPRTRRHDKRLAPSHSTARPTRLSAYRRNWDCSVSVLGFDNVADRSIVDQALSLKLRGRW